MSDDVVDVIDAEGPAPVTEPATPENPLPRLRKFPGGVPDLDGTVLQLQASAPDLPLRLRLQPDFWTPKLRKQRFTNWRGVVWYVEMTGEQALRYREAQQAFLLDWIEQERNR